MRWRNSRQNHRQYKNTLADRCPKCWCRNRRPDRFRLSASHRLGDEALDLPAGGGVGAAHVIEALDRRRLDRVQGLPDQPRDRAERDPAFQEGRNRRLVGGIEDRPGAAAGLDNPHLAAMVSIVTPPDPTRNFPIQFGVYLPTTVSWLAYISGKTLQDTSHIDLEAAYRRMLADPNQPYLVDVVVRRDENVYPMIPAGGTYRDVIASDADL